MCDDRHVMLKWVKGIYSNFMNIILLFSDASDAMFGLLWVFPG
ncbi:hypothetical protein A79E_0870 [Klebsiella pneumoniae subsp. pneumoniae 1084]|nr:hypothetical protein A79E_0870 [Klebsiella pneumoniae subsp. pneumoniae 1084]AUB46279.1 hypothetical protein SGH10_000881 [Klebsiella pneumoniae]BAH65015.1 hypothetical protein KP1_4510 [Klebsiella pneumoniae subsp. pneumoniae NTUH-K2044]